MNIGILGGTFDPIHNGHLALCQSALEKLPIQKIYLIPSFIHPFKGAKSLFNFDQRCELISLAIQEKFPHGNKVDLVDIEKQTPHENYTYQTLEKLHAKQPNDKFYFFIGTDNLNALHLWKELDKIFALANLVCFYRKGYELEPILESIKNKLTPERLNHINQNSFLVDLPDISSTDIRHKLNQNQSIKGLTAISVIKKITEYKSSASNFLDN